MNGERFKLASGIKAKSGGLQGRGGCAARSRRGRVHFAIVGLAVVAVHQGRPVDRAGDGHAAALVDPARRADHRRDAPRLRARRLALHGRTKGTPQAILTKISQDVKRVLELPDVKQRFENIDFVAAPTTPDEHNRIILADLRTFTGVVQLAGLRPNKAQ